MRLSAWNICWPWLDNTISVMHSSSLSSSWLQEDATAVYVDAQRLITSGLNPQQSQARSAASTTVQFHFCIAVTNMYMYCQHFLNLVWHISLYVPTQTVMHFITNPTVLHQVLRWLMRYTVIYRFALPKLAPMSRDCLASSHTSPAQELHLPVQPR